MNAEVTSYLNKHYAHFTDTGSYRPAYIPPRPHDVDLAAIM